MKFLLEFLTILFVGVVPATFACYLSLVHPNYGDELTPIQKSLTHWLASAAMICAGLLVALDHPGGLASLGLYPGQADANIDAFMFACRVGLIVALGRIIIVWLFHKLRKTEVKPLPVDLRVISAHRTVWEKVVFLTVLPFGVFAEEVIYRGYLVLLLGKETGNFLPWAVLSIILFAAIHLYQGRSWAVLGWHLVTAIVFTAAAVYTGNLVAPIGFHLLLNLIGTIRVFGNPVEKSWWAIPQAPVPGIRKLLYGIFIAVNGLLFLYILVLFTFSPVTR